MNYTKEQVEAMNAEQIKDETRKQLDAFVKQMACAPSQHLDAFHVNNFKAINEALRVPTAAEMLRTLDDGAFGAGASDFCMRIMNHMLKLAIDLEDTTYEKVVEAATWRKEPPYA